MDIKRVFSHLFSGTFAVRRAFSSNSLDTIENAVKTAERCHRGEICVVIEGALDLASVLRGINAKQQALAVFSQRRIWDTEHNNGVLIYLLLADRDVEIVADRGIHARVAEEAWEQICKDMETYFREKKFEEGVLAGVKAVASRLRKHYPNRPGASELPDRPIVL